MKRLSNTHQVALRLYSLGQPPSKISEQVHLSPSRICALVKDPMSVDYLKSLEGELDNQFKGLYTKVIRTLEAALDCADASVALAGANLWLKAQGKFVHKVEHRDLTAEDIIAKIISGELVVPDRGLNREPKLIGEGEGLGLGQRYEEADFEEVEAKVN